MHITDKRKDDRHLSERYIDISHATITSAPYEATTVRI